MAQLRTLGLLALVLSPCAVAACATKPEPLVGRFTLNGAQVTPAALKQVLRSDPDKARNRSVGFVLVERNADASFRDLIALSDEFGLDFGLLNDARAGRISPIPE